MNAMIFAAGLGTRLQPITNTKPKALVEIGGFTLLEIAIRKLINFGIKRIVINVHHFAELIIDFIDKNNFSNTEILISHEKDNLLDTGGGLVRAKGLFIENSPIIIYNVDVLTNINFSELIEYHNINNNLVTMFVQKRDATRYLLFDKNNQLCGWNNPKTGEEKWSTTQKSATKLGYNGIQIVDYKIFSYLPTFGAFSIIPYLVELAATHKICAWRNDKAKWFDLGTIEKLQKVVEYSDCIL